MNDDMHIGERSAHDMGTDIRANVQRLLMVVEEIRHVQPQMEMNQLSVLLRIALEPDILAQDLMRATGLQKSAISRNVGALSKGYKGRSDRELTGGLALVDQARDACNGTKRPLRLTSAGQTFVGRLSEIMMRKK